MALDFTVIIGVRQRFGDFKPDVSGLEMNAPWVGEEKEFDFRCPNVDSSQAAILLFQCQGANGSTLQINGHAISGAIQGGRDVTLLPTSPPETVVRARWNGSILLVRPGVLSENNVLRIVADEVNPFDFDDFIIDNVVVVFKTM